ncbi:MAG: methyltransferase domain-containing protein [Propionibacteriales bacterium]|nr:methyltransferase domain-containing protein [Propionibacteriales bacterium]
MARELSVPDFEALYRRDPDPWRVTSSWYEQRKLAVVLASLPRSRYRSGWEPGCGPGIVSETLADRVDDLVASDVSRTAIELAKQRCDRIGHVRFTVSGLPAVAVDRPVELVFVAEFLYYVDDLAAALEAIWSATLPGGHVAFMHWAHQPDDAYRSGPSMHADIAIDSVDRDARRVVTHVDSDFLLDIYEAVR